MKIHEYNEMMRYLTRPASPSMDQGPTDDVIPQEQKPKTFYGKDSVMPSFDGMEDPKALEDYRQIELADGGVVEREGFNGGTDPNELLSKKEIELFKKEIEDAYPGVKINDTKAGKINPRTIELRYRRQQGDKKFAKKRGLIPTKENLDVLRETAKNFSNQAKKEGFDDASLVESKKAKLASQEEIDLFKKEIKDKYPGVYAGKTTDNRIVVRYIKAGYRDKNPVFDKGRALIPTKENLNILRESADDIYNQAKEEGISKVRNRKKSAEVGALRRTKDQAELFDNILEKINQGKNFKYKTLAEKEMYRKLLNNIYTHHNKKAATTGKEGTVFLQSFSEKEIDAVTDQIRKTKGLEELFRESLKGVIRKTYPEGSKARKEAFENFSRYNRVAKEIENKFGTQFQLEHPLSRKAIERAGGIKESLLRVKAVPKSFNDFKGGYDIRLNDIQRKLVDPELDPKLKLQAQKQLKSLNEIGRLMFEGYDVGQLTSTGKVKRYGSDPFIKTDLIEGLKKSLTLNDQVKKNVIKYKSQLAPLFDSAGFTKKSKFNIKKAENLAPIAKQKQILNFIDKLNPSEQKVLKKFGDKVGMGFDPTEIINALPEREAQIIRGVGSKIGNIAKLGARGLAELTTGLGPLGIGITAAVTAPFALYDVSQGDRASEVLQNTVSDLTFGLTPRADERIIRDIGGESAVRGYEIQQKIDEFRIARDDLKNLNEQLNDPSSTLLSEDQDSILASIERNKNIIKERGTYLQSLINEEGKVVSPEYNDYLKAAKKQTMEKNIRKEMRGFDGGDDYYNLDDTNPELENLMNDQETLEKTYVGNQPKQPGLVGQYFGIVPNRGRVGLRLGGSKKLFNLLKKSKKDKPKKELTEKEVQDIMDDPQPENPDRRDFLKGAGALGLAVAAFGTGALKLAKTLKTKTALKVLAEPAVGQPAWFAPLVDKILLKGSIKKIDDFAKNVDPSKPVQFEERSLYAKDYPNKPVATYGLKPILEKSTAEKLGNVTRDLNTYELEEGGKKFTLTKGPGDGNISIDVEGGGAYDDSFTLSHVRYNVQDIETGKIKEIREFQALEMRPEYVNMGGDEHGIDYALEATKDEVFIGKDVFKLEKNGTGFLSDLEGVEKIATGKIKNPKLAETRTKVRNKLNDDPYKDRNIDDYDYQLDQEIGHDYID
jgi:hypothetical protein